LLDKRAITLAYVEIAFAPIYAGNPLYHQIAAFLEDNGLDLFRIYSQCYGTSGRHVGGDALFVERSVLKKYLDQSLRAAQAANASAAAAG
jgi:hypothetical protein